MVYTGGHTDPTQYVFLRVAFGQVATAARRSQGAVEWQKDGAPAEPVGPELRSGTDVRR